MVLKRKRIYAILRKKFLRKKFGDSRGRDTPVPISNTAVKSSSADGTLTETSRESRSLPDFI